MAQPETSHKRRASEDWERSPAVKYQKVYYDVGQGHSCDYRSVSMTSDEPQSLDDQLSALATSFQRLRISSAFEQLPDEILSGILEHLAPDAIEVGPGTSLLDRQRSAKWQSFFASRSDVINFGLVNKRFNRIANPFRYRSLLVSQPFSLCRLVMSFLMDPSLASQVRHLSAALVLDSHQTVIAVAKAWKLLCWTHLPRHTPRFPCFHPYWNVFNWLGGLNHENPKYPSALFCTMLSFTNRLESLNFRADPPQDNPPTIRSPLWNWFLDDENPFAEADNSIPKGIVVGFPSREQLSSCPTWPPPNLRDITIESDLRGEGSTVFKLDVVPHVDGVEHRYALVNSGLSTRNPVELLKRETIRAMSGSEHTALRSYLDGIMRIPELEDADDDVHAHVETLKSLTFTPVPTPINITAARKLEATLKLLPLEWSPRLSVRRKRVAFSLNEFLHDGKQGRTLDQTISMKNLDTLTLRAEKVAFGCPSVENPSRFATGRLSLQRRLLDDTAPYGQCLKHLHLLLRMEEPVTASMYLPGDGRITGLHRLAKLKELSITTEGLFGGWHMLRPLFGGPEFVEALTGPVNPYGRVDELDDVPVSNGDVDGDGDGEKLRAIVEDLPHLETLRLIDWYAAYANPIQLPITKQSAATGAKQDWVTKLAALQKSMMLGLRKLAPILKERRPSVKHVTFWIHKWDNTAADAVWPDWSKSKDGLKKMKKVYKEAGITLRVVKGA
ncbi:hypothetical protein OQA88_8264 [Cercophora sp. LCS_1]